MQAHRDTKQTLSKNLKKERKRRRPAEQIKN